jgi:hypothetical protein
LIRAIVGMIVAFSLFLAGGILLYYSIDYYNQTIISQSTDCLSKGGCVPVNYIPYAITYAILGALSLGAGVLTLMLTRKVAKPSFLHSSKK